MYEYEYTLGNTAFNAINEELMTAYHQVAVVSMKNAAEEIKSSVVDADRLGNLAKCCVSLDCTWQKRGHASLNGVVTAIGYNGKCLDYHVLSSIVEDVDHGKIKKVLQNIISGK